MKIKLLLAAAAILFCIGASSQDRVPRWALKTNLLYDATTTINLGVEVRLGHRSTLEVPVSFNPWDFSGNKKLKHFFVQPEFRRWFCEAFDGHFWGIHVHGGMYNVGGIGPFETIKDHRYEGWAAGAGISYGYHWIITNRISMEFTIGAGYVYLDYDRYGQAVCDPLEKSYRMHYFGPTKAGITFMFMIK